MSATGEISGEQLSADRPWTVSDSSLAGRSVLTSDGQLVGQVVALAINTGTWQVSSLELKIEREMHHALGLKKALLHRTTMSLPTDVVGAVKDTVVLNVTTAELRHRLSDSASVH